MAIEVNELLADSRAYTQSQAGDSDSQTMVYEVTGTTSEITAGATLAPFLLNSRQLPSGTLVHLKTIECEPGGIDDRWVFTVNYSINAPEEDPEQPNNPTFFASSFDTSGGTFHRTHSIATRKYGDAADAEDFKNAIEFDGETVRGVDVVIPQLRINRTVAYPQNYATDAFADTIADLTGKTNEQTFFGRQPGEVLLLGAAGENTGQPLVFISYSFLISKNLSGLTVAGIPNVSKDGHEYMWVHWVNEPGDNARIAKPKQVYVETIYDPGDFSALGIPGA